MIFIIAAISNIIAIIGIILLLNVLFKRVKKESGNWTASLIFLVLILGTCSIDKPKTNNSNENKIQFSSICEKCILKPNRTIKIKDKLNFFQSLNHTFELYIPEDKGEIKVISRYSTISGFVSGLGYEYRSSYFKLNDKDKIEYLVNGSFESRFFLVIPYVFDYDNNGEK